MLMLATVLLLSHCYKEAIEVVGSQAMVDFATPDDAPQKLLNAG